MNHTHRHHHETENLSDVRLIWAIVLNLLLTVAEVVAGIFSGSLSLLADAAHNFNDCMSLVITLVARIVSRKEADRRRTFGYRRAEVIGALVNLLLLMVIGLYLLVDAAGRFLGPHEVQGWPMILAAGVALAVDLATAAFLLGMAKGSINLRAGFLHKVSDALASVGVIGGGVLILMYQWYVADLIITVVIAGYILWQSLWLLRPTVAILMQSVPPDIDLDHLIAALSQTQGVQDIHHVHVWELDERHRSLEAHVLIEQNDTQMMEEIKGALKRRLLEEFSIHHSTLEFEFPDSECVAAEHSW